ncbi:hypothetical protein AAKU67_001117 [Oxalobacteraceae bacterium GrIS 2.11]
MLKLLPHLAEPRCQIQEATKSTVKSGPVFSAKPETQGLTRSRSRVLGSSSLVSALVTGATSTSTGAPKQVPRDKSGQTLALTVVDSDSDKPYTPEDDELGIGTLETAPVSDKMSQTGERVQSFQSSQSSSSGSASSSSASSSSSSYASIMSGASFLSGLSSSLWSYVRSSTSTSSAPVPEAEPKLKTGVQTLDTLGSIDQSLQKLKEKCDAKGCSYSTVCADIQFVVGNWVAKGVNVNVPLAEGSAFGLRYRVGDPAVTIVCAGEIVTKFPVKAIPDLLNRLKFDVDPNVLGPWESHAESFRR